MYFEAGRKLELKSNGNRIRNEIPNVRTLEINIFSCSSRSFII